MIPPYTTHGEVHSRIHVPPASPPSLLRPTLWAATIAHRALAGFAHRPMRQGKRCLHTRPWLCTPQDAKTCTTRRQAYREYAREDASGPHATTTILLREPRAVARTSRPSVRLACLAQHNAAPASSPLAEASKPHTLGGTVGRTIRRSIQLKAYARAVHDDVLLINRADDGSRV